MIKHEKFTAGLVIDMDCRAFVVVENKETGESMKIKVWQDNDIKCFVSAMNGFNMGECYIVADAGKGASLEKFAKACVAWAKFCFTEEIFVVDELGV